MNLLKTILPAALATLTMATVASAQSWTIGSISTGSFYATITPPTLPSVQSKFNSYDRGIGNTWLGGNVHAYAGIVRQKSGNYELGNATVEFQARANVLKQSLEVAEIAGTAMNVMNNGVQNRNGSFRIDLLGYTIVNQSFQNNSTFAAQSQLFNLFGPNGVSASVPVGPISMTLKGNAGCGFSRSANWLLPAATATVGLNATGGAHAFANASVGFGIPGFSLGVGLNGKILEQTLTGNVSASGLWGLSGSMTYTLKAISLTLYAYAEAFWHTWTTDLCSWSAGLFTLNLI